MNKLSGVGILIGLVACAGLAFSIVELRGVTTSMAKFDERLAKLESAPAVAPAAFAGPPAFMATVSEVQNQLTKLKSEVAAVKSEQALLASGTTSGTKPPDGERVTVKVGDDLKAAVEEVLVAREAKADAERKERDAKRTSDFMARAQTGMIDTLTKELGLTAQQKSQVADIVTVQMTAFREAFSNRKEGEDPQAKMAELKKDTDTKIKAVLTPEQGIKYDELAKNPMAMMGGGGFGGGGRRNGGGGSGPDGGN